MQIVEEYVTFEDAFRIIDENQVQNITLTLNDYINADVFRKNIIIAAGRNRQNAALFYFIFHVRRGCKYICTKKVIFEASLMKRSYSNHIRAIIIGSDDFTHSYKVLDCLSTEPAPMQTEDSEDLLPPKKDPRTYI